MLEAEEPFSIFFAQAVSIQILLTFGTDTKLKGFVFSFGDVRGFPRSKTPCHGIDAGLNLQ